MIFIGNYWKGKGERVVMGYSDSRPTCTPVKSFDQSGLLAYYLSFQIVRPPSSHSLMFISNMDGDELLSIS